MPGFGWGLECWHSPGGVYSRWVWHRLRAHYWERVHCAHLVRLQDRPPLFTAHSKSIQIYRCLPGDRGIQEKVSASCGDDKVKAGGLEKSLSGDGVRIAKRVVSDHIGPDFRVTYFGL